MYEFAVSMETMYKFTMLMTTMKGCPQLLEMCYPLVTAMHHWFSLSTNYYHSVVTQLVHCVCYNKA